ncbi:MAG: radical SAM family heme chaperone HemW [Proteobacteria bacterium]|nr:radical SAM family heme chaperone HemW [Pseudomonadota bacterium]
MLKIEAIPLSLYIHFPWCVKKCPYCDFNSHTLDKMLPEEQYIDALLLNLKQHLPLIQHRTIKSIFMGGGTPSLFSPQAFDKLLQGIYRYCNLASDIEITLEANPGTVEQQRFKAYRAIGINRLSLGIQSFNKKHLKILGRIHDDKEALQAIDCVKQAGFSNFNLDLMFGLPQQTQAEGLACLETAIAMAPTHISWYELTIEPNTPFWHKPPTLPLADDIATLQEVGQARLAQAGFQQYEVSAYAKKPCLHNLNYWEFGDYLAIGAGSHAKITHPDTQKIERFHHHRHPKKYMELTGFVQSREILSEEKLPFEFMLNALRLKNGVPSSYFSERTNIMLDTISKHLLKAQHLGLIKPFSNQICTTLLGYRFLNEAISIFLPNP